MGAKIRWRDQMYLQREEQTQLPRTAEIRRRRRRRRKRRKRRKKKKIV